MVPQPAAYAVPAFAAAVLALLLAALASRHRRKPVTGPFVVFMLALGVWSLASALQLGFDSVAGQRPFDRIAFVGAAVVPTAWLVLTARYSNHDDWLSRRALLALAVEPAVTLALVWTNGWHGLVWREATMDSSAAIPVVVYSYGPWYWVNLAYSYLLVLAGIGLLVLVFRRSSGIYRKQAGTLIVGAAVPLAANVAFTAGASPVPEIDLTPFSFAITGSFFALALFRFDLLDRTPVARRRMIDELGDGFLVLDADERIVEANANARRILDIDSPAGEPASGVLPGDDLDEVEGTVIPAGDGSRGFYEVRCVPLRDYQEELAGYLLALRDVTDRKEYEQRLEVANRLLRHNLRNETNVILAHADALATELRGDLAERASTIEDAAGRIADLSTKARRMEDTLRVSAGEPDAVDAGGIANRAVDRFADSFPDARLSFDGAEEVLARAIDPDLLETAVGNLIENAIEHHDGTPTVRVSVEPGDPVRIRVADDGPGVPAMEHEVIAEGRETTLRHGSGLGLWLVHWVVSASGGDLRFEENDPSGSVVTIELPAA